MRILTWNIQNSGVIDLNNPQRENIKNILCQIEELQADVVALQEFQYEYYDEIVKNGLEKWTIHIRYIVIIKRKIFAIEY